MDRRLLASNLREWGSGELIMLAYCNPPKKEQLPQMFQNLELRFKNLPLPGVAWSIRDVQSLWH